MLSCASVCARRMPTEKIEKTGFSEKNWGLYYVKNIRCGLKRLFHVQSATQMKARRNHCVKEMHRGSRQWDRSRVEIGRELRDVRDYLTNSGSTSEFGKDKNLVV